MIFSHINAEHLQDSLKKKFDIEIELLCLNHHFMDKEKLEQELYKYKMLKTNLKHSILKESEFHLPEAPYYEMSIYCNKEEFSTLKEEILNASFQIDLIHFQGDSFTGEEFERTLDSLSS